MPFSERLPEGGGGTSTGGGPERGRRSELPCPAGLLQLAVRDHARPTQAGACLDLAMAQAPSAKGST